MTGTILRPTADSAASAPTNAIPDNAGHGLRDYQARDLARINACPARRVLFVATVAYGKSLMIAALTEQEPGAVLILSNRIQVVGQLRDRIGAGAEVMTVQTASRRLDRITPPALILADEIHKGGAAEQYRSVFEAFPEARVVGFTGSPTRELFDVFEEVVEGESAAALTERGFLAPLRYFAATSRLDLSGIRKRGDDFDPAQLVAELDRRRITGDAIDAYRRHAAGRPCLAFAVNVAHAESIRGEFQAAGIAAEVITGADKDDARKAKIARLAAGGLLISVDTLTEGFDMAHLHAILDLAPTLSLARHLQRHGRVARAHPGKAAGLVLDCGQNTLRHGTITEPRDWRAPGEVPKTEKTADGERLGIRQCPSCLAIHLAGPDTCPSCGQPWGQDRRISAAAQERLDEIAAEELIRARRLAQRKRRDEEAACRTLADWRVLGDRRGHQPGWAVIRFRERNSRAK